VFAAVLLFGPDVATLIVALDTFILTSWLRAPNRSTLRALFNMSAGATAIWLAAHIFAAMLPSALSGTPRLEQLLVPVFFLALSYFIINSSLVAIALGFERHVSPLDIWRRSFIWLSLNYFGGASVAILLVTYTRNLDLGALSAIVPLLVIIYLTFRTSLGRLDDANKHVAQLNELYLSTVETLAMAVDAKDQITHGHIRRVQVYAVELAKRLGIREDSQLKAIEAAALLHDMGKLAIPEHILNKPGKLTPAEFDKMKRHADVGADLLSSITFPYPVVPIVRHHHEHWDGTGYPSRISGTDIPFGARILSVVDCFDALTSDRPYRPRLGPNEAFEVIRERRGTMYDPLVVDTFVKAYPEIAPLATRAGQDARTILSTADLSRATDTEPAAFRQISASASESALLLACGKRISQSASLGSALEVASQCLRQLTPATVYAVFIYDSESDVLVCDRVSGDAKTLVLGLRIPVGERVTGWCAANRRASLNANASLDLGEIARLFQPNLRSTISAPLVRDERLPGVLSAYSAGDSAFNEAHQYAFEQVAARLADFVLVRQSETRSTKVAQFPKPAP
jgi:putative nucleotidyltransferase with HDIG domain